MQEWVTRHGWDSQSNEKLKNGMEPSLLSLKHEQWQTQNGCQTDQKDREETPGVAIAWNRNNTNGVGETN